MHNKHAKIMNVPDYRIINPKLTSEELIIFRKRLDRQGGIKRAAESTGLHRNTIRMVAMAGCGTDKTIDKIREFIKGGKNA